MQKKLLGMAVAAALAAPAVALAQSAVQVYGTVHLSFAQSQFSNVPAAAGGDVTKFGVNSAASNWGLRSTETLGGGMTAWLQMEFNAQMERRNAAGANGAIPSNGEGSFRNSGLACAAISVMCTSAPGKRLGHRPSVSGTSAQSAAGAR